MGITIQVAGLAEVIAKLQALPEREHAASQLIARDVGVLLEQQTKTNLALTSHPRSTPTPSPPGSPPSLVSGNLRRSVLTTGPTDMGTGYGVMVGATAVYSRIQELGGTAGRGAQLPPRPYLKPALDTALPGIQRIAVARWNAMLR